MEPVLIVLAAIPLAWMAQRRPRIGAANRPSVDAAQSSRIAT
jgi:hypothetical protein